MCTMNEYHISCAMLILETYGKSNIEEDQKCNVMNSNGYIGIKMIWYTTEIKFCDIQIDCFTYFFVKLSCRRQAVFINYIMKLIKSNK